MTLRSLLKALNRFIAQIASDAMLAVCFAAPFMAGAAFKILFPLAERLVSERLGRAGLVSRFYPLADLFTAFLTGYMVAFASAMVMLEERDDGTAAYLAVTPLGRSGYLASRLALPLLFTVPLTILVLALFHLSAFPLSLVLFLALAAVPVSAGVALFIVSFSGNRVEGLALGKLAGLILISLTVPFLVTDPVGYAAGVFPTYWAALFALKGSYAALGAFGLIALLWLVPLWNKFSRLRL